MPEKLFVFVQMEFPWSLGPPDGRYLVRAYANREPEHVLVLGTLGAGRAELIGGKSSRGGWSRARSVNRRRGERAVPPQPPPVPVPTTRATVIDPVPLSAEPQAKAWLKEIDRDREVEMAAAVINRALHLHRLANADPYAREISPAQALVIRAGWGAGEQVADGRWLHARELSFVPRPAGSAGTPRRRVRDRSAALRPQERLAALLSGRTRSLLCEEHVLRARLDLDHSRVRSAAMELDRAYAAALPELRAEGRQDLAVRIAELEQLSPGVAREAARALPAPMQEGQSDAHAPAGNDSSEREPVEEDVVRHALERLEAALRARTATGFTVS